MRTRLLTERLLLETLTLDECRALRAGDRSGRTWAHDYPTDGDLVVAGIVCEAGEAYDESTPVGLLQVRLRATGEAVGGIGFLWPPEDGVAEVGYGLAASARRRGLAGEALDAVLAHVARHGVSTVVAVTSAGNEPSQRVLERQGFRRGQLEDLGEDDGPGYRWTLGLG